MEEKKQNVYRRINKGVRRNFVTRSRRWKVTSRLRDVEKDNMQQKKKAYQSPRLVQHARPCLTVFSYALWRKAPPVLTSKNEKGLFPVF
ncbi:hypothetical protein TNCV_263281 [Trichonephila clavipes]|nr:hypothetical protein TNCV_263281 [Trichonephila clavipes]